MTLIYLLIEFLDELVYGVSEAAWPFIRADLGLTYAQIGLALSLPGLIGNIVEPFLAILGDVWKRRVLILIGGIFFTLSLYFTSLSQSFFFLLFSFILFNPASGAFVSLSQATLMDSDPARREHNMARWTFAGSLGVLAGPLLLGLLVYFGLGWRGTYALLASISTLVLLLAFKRIPADSFPSSRPSLRVLLDGFRAAFSALKRREVWRWLLLLEFADLMMDVLLSFLAIYFVDVAQVSETQAGIAVTFWLFLGLFTDFAFIPFIDRQPNGIKFLRITAAAPRFWTKALTRKRARFGTAKEKSHSRFSS